MTQDERKLLEVEQKGDEAYEDHFRKTFITENKKPGIGAAFDHGSWTSFDMQIPQGQRSKLIKIPDPYTEDFRASEVCDRLKFIDSSPVIIMAGAMNQDRDCRTMAGICRAAFNTKATIIDSGMSSNIEKHCIRRGVELLGVCP